MIHCLQANDRLPFCHRILRSPGPWHTLPRLKVAESNPVIRKNVENTCPCGTVPSRHSFGKGRGTQASHGAHACGNGRKLHNMHNWPDSGRSHARRLRSCCYPLRESRAFAPHRGDGSRRVYCARLGPCEMRLTLCTLTHTLGCIKTEGGALGRLPRPVW